MLSVGFTGTRQGMSEAQSAAVSDLLSETLAPVAELHHGDCIGADTEAHAIALNHDIPVILHPPEVPKFRAWNTGAAEYRPPLPYLVRNHAIVDETHILIAAPLNHEGNGGTWATIKYARSKRKPIAMITPAGSIEWDYFAWLLAGLEGGMAI